MPTRLVEVPAGGGQRSSVFLDETIASATASAALDKDILAAFHTGTRLSVEKSFTKCMQVCFCVCVYVCLCLWLCKRVTVQCTNLPPEFLSHPLTHTHTHAHHCLSPFAPIFFFFLACDRTHRTCCGR